MNNVSSDGLMIHVIETIITVLDDKQSSQRRASVCSLDSGTSLSFLSSNGTRSSDNRTRRNQDPTTRSTEV